MKHRLLCLLFATLVAVSGFSAINYSLNESFESGIPASWTQEVVNPTVGGEWILDTLATYPDGAYDGEHRAALRSLEGMAGYCVRLVTPELNLSQVNNPQLSFAYAQVRRGSSQAGYYSDTLSVYYRTSSSSNWILIRKLAEYQPAWKLETLDLPAAARSASCQLAFEAKENGGRGVVLDYVRVFPKSTCMDVELSGVTVASDAALISWTTNPNPFEVIISASKITDPSSYDHSQAVYDVDNYIGNGITIDSLDPVTTYYAYVRTHCSDNESGYTSWVSTTFTTANKMPYTHALGAVPANWLQMTGDAKDVVTSADLAANTSSTYKWAPPTSTAVFGKAHLCGRPNSSPIWLLSTAIDLSQVEATSHVDVSFDFAMTNNTNSNSANSAVSSAKLHIYSSGDDGATWTLERTIVGSEMSNLGKRYHVLVDNYIGSTVRLAIVAEGSSSHYFHIADFSVAESDGVCLGIYGLKSTISPNSATFRWSVVGVTNAAEVILSDSANFANPVSVQNVSTPAVQFSGLTSNTTYYLMVRQDCEGGDTLIAKIKTPCDPMVISQENAWTEDFNSYAAGDFTADCWKNEHISGTGAKIFDIYSSSNGGNSTKQLRLPDMSRGTMTLLALPPMTIDQANSYIFQLDVYRNATGTSYPEEGIRVYVSSKDEIDDNAVELGFISRNCQTPSTTGTTAIPAESASGWYTYSFEIPMSGNLYVLLRGESQYGSSTYMDNFMVSRIPDCRKVKGLNVDNIGINTARATFNSNGAAQYELLVVTNAMDPDTLNTPSLVAFQVQGTDTTYAISGLSAATVYYAYTRALCGESNGEWSSAAIFTTECGPMTVTQAQPWEEDFNSYSSGAFAGTCWFNKHTAGTATSVFTIATTSNGNNSTKQLQLPDMQDGNVALLGLPQLIVEEAGAYTFSLDVYRTSNYDTYTTEGIRIFASQTDTIDGSAVEMAFVPRVYKASSSTVPAVSAVGWYTYTFVIPVAGPSVRILIQGESRYGAATYMDNFKIVKLPSCRPATGITLASVTSDAVSLRYTGVSSAQQYQVIVSTASIDLSDLAVGTIVYDNMVSGTSVDISNLASSTRYYAYIRSYCGNDEYSAWSDEFTFRTQCAAVTVADFGLETFEDPASTDCWTFGFGTEGSSTSGAYAQRDSLKAYGSYIKLSKESVAYTKNAAGVDTVYNDGAYAITPQLSMDDIRNYQISFMAATTSNLSTNLKRLNIGVMANPSDFSSMQTLKTIELDYAADSMALKSYTVSLANVEEDIFGDMPSYIIFQLKEATKHDSTNFALIDNIIFEPASGCEQILESRVDSLEGTWADLSWENTGADSYEVLLSDINTRRPDTISNPIHSEEVSATNIHLSNLTGNTLYYAYVRGFCAEDTAKWSNALAFRTTQTPVVPPYADDFESDLQWLFVNGSEPNLWIWGNNVKNGGEKSLYISNDESTNAYTNNVASVVFATKYFQFDKTGTYIFQYDWKAAGESTYDYLRVALAPYDAELVAGNLPASMSTTAMPDGWIALDGGGKLNLQTTWQTVTEEVKVPAGKYKVVFVWKNDNSQGDNPPAAIDNFSIEIIDCPKPSRPNVTLTPGDGSIATISWEKEFEDVNTWLLEYATDTAFNNAVDTIVSDTIVDLTGLTPETVYYARLKSLCAEDAESEWSAVISFLPTDSYFMTVFDGSANNDVVPVYGNWVDNLMVSQFIVPADSIWALQWGSITQLTFFSNTAETDWGAAQFEVYMAEVQDTTLSGLVSWNTMTKVLNATSLAISDNQMVVTLDQPYSYENGNLLIGFKQTVSGTYKACSWKGVAASTGASYGGYGTSLSQKSFLPKMDIYYLPGEQPTCPKVRGIQIDHIDADSARIAVRDQDASGYHFLVASSQISPDAMSAADSARLIYDETVVGDTVLHINGLRSASTYYVYVSAICGDDQSPWSGASFVSACGVYTIADGSSYSENFNLLTSGIPTCWDNSRGTTATESYKWNYYSDGYEGACLRFNSYNNADGNTDTLVTPALFLQDDAILSFYWKNPTGGSAQVFVSADGGVTKTVLESNLIGKSDWTKYEKNLSAYTGQRIQIFFASTSNYGNGDAYHYLDNFKVGAVPSCAPVTGVAYELTTGNGTIASISWSADTIATFVVEYSTAADFADPLSVTVSDTTAVTLSGLTPETTYYAHVKVICDASSESEWSDAIRFTPSNAYAMTINNGTATSSYIPFNGYYADGGESNGQFIIPASSLTEIQWSTITQLTFYTGTTTVSFGSDTWAVYAAETSASTLTDLVDWSTLTKVRNAGTVSISDGKMVITFDTPFHYEEGNLLIGFEQTGGDTYSSISWIGVTASSGVSYYSYYDYDYYYTYDGASTFLPKMTIDYIPGERPACMKPTGLAAELTMGDGTVASLSWNTEAAKSVIQYATTEDFAEAVTDTIIDTTAVALSGLTPETVYYARVQSICEGDVPSDWSATISFLPTNALSMTIANGTTTNDYMPIYGLWTDNYTYGQFIVPADSIEALQWDTITQLTFYSSDANISWGNAQFEVYMAEVSSTTINALEDWNSLTQVKSAGSLSIVDNQMVVDLTNPFAYTDGNLLIGFKQTASGTYKSSHWYGTTLNGASFGGYGTTLSQRNFLPKVTFGFLNGEEPACIAPKALKASAISSNSADIRFKASAAPSYELVVALDTINPDTLNLVDASLIVRHDTIDTAYIALSGLVQQTEYYVYVRGLCNETDLSTWSSMQFTTRCVAAVPFEENFDDSQNRVPAYEGATSDFIPTCWSEGYESRTYVSKIVNNTTTSTYAYSAPGALYLNSSSTYKSYVVLPELDAQLDTLQLTFKARAMYQGSSSVTNRATSYYAHSVKVGTMTDPEDYSTFKLLDTYVLAEVSSPSSADSYWEDVTIYLQGAQGKYIALVSDFDKSNEVWIDDIEISKAPDCLAPSGISVAVKTTTADISWGSVATRFEVAFGPAGFVMPNADTIITVTDTTGLRLENLVPGSAYDIYLRAECAEDLFSDWSAVKTFATAAGVPFNDDFENGNFWTLINGSADNKWSWGTAVSNEGTHSLYISEDGGTSHSYDNSSSTMVFATRTIFFEEGGYVFGYDWMAEGEVSSYGSVYDYLRVALVPENTSLAAGVTPTGFGSTTLPTGWIALDSSALAGSADWNHVYSEEIHLDEGAYTVVLAWKNDGNAGSNPPAAIDNFSVAKVECSAPSAPRVSNITTNGATIHVDTIAEAYEIIVLQVSDTIVKQSIVGVDSLVIESLSAASMYTVKARGLCGEGVYSNWSAPVAFGTSCAPIATLPWDEDFEAMPTGDENSDAPMCWDMLNTNLGHYPNVYVSTAAAHESTQSLYFKTSSNYSSGYAILPEFEQPANLMKVSFYYKHESVTSSGDLQFGYMTDISSEATFVPLVSCPKTTTWTPVTVMTTAIPAELASSARLVFRNGPANSSTWYYAAIDDIHIEELNPNCLGIENLSVSSLSLNAVTIDFRFVDGLDHNAHVAISKEAAFDPSTAIMVDTIADSTYTFNIALEENTLYYVYARQDCGEGESSAWESISFRSNCVAITELPWSEGFEGMELGNSSSDAPECWDLLNANQGTYPYVYVNNSTNYVQTGTQSLYFQSSADVPAYAILPEFGVAMDSLQVSFAYRNEGVSASNGTLSFGYMTDIADGGTFVQLAECKQITTFTTVEVSTNSIPAALGHSVRLAFRYTGGSMNNYYAAVDDIRINKVVSENYSAEICNGNDYVANGFNVTEDDYHVGVNTFINLHPAVEGSGRPDTISTLTLTVHEIALYEDSVVLCEGEMFSENIHGANFSFEAKLNMTEQVRYVPNAFGCEDMVRLRVTVNPKVEEHIYDSIAQGDNYVWHGQTYMSATVAQFDTVSAVTGCDSTVYLHLSVYQKPDPHEAVENIYAKSLIIAPNPVRAGEPIHILNTFSEANLPDVKVEIFSAAGALVYTQKGAEKPFILPGLPISGVYTVRVIAGDEIYIASLLVH